MRRITSLDVSLDKTRQDNEKMKKKIQHPASPGRAPVEREGERARYLV